MPHITRDLHLDSAQAGGIAGVFYWGYCVLQIPGGHLAKHWSAKKFISILMIAWGVSAAGCGLARTAHELMFMRVMLGIAEGGVFPATLILLSHWFSRAERARANAFWLMCLPGAVIFSSPVSGWMLDHWNWRVMMIAEGALPIAWLAVWLLCIEDHPSQVSWLTPEDRDQIVQKLSSEAADLEASRGASYFHALLRPQVLLLIAVYFCFTGGQMGMLFWLPSALERVTKVSNLSAGILNTVPLYFRGGGSVCDFAPLRQVPRASRTRGRANVRRRRMPFRSRSIDWLLSDTRICIHCAQRDRCLRPDASVLGDSDGNSAG